MWQERWERRTESGRRERCVQVCQRIWATVDTTLPLNILYQLGICVAVGILLDTFVVRGLLVPGIVLILGKWNWWPGKLEEVRTDEVEQEDEVSGQVAITGTGAE